SSSMSSGQGGMTRIMPMSSVIKDGITWTFSQAVPVGQFVTGDYFVVGPVTITDISPAPESSAPYKNGSVKNLPTSGKSAFDQRLDDGSDPSSWFDPGPRVYAPVVLQPGDALVSSISVDQTHSLPEAFGDPPNPTSSSPIRTMSVLTVLATAPDA